MIGKRPISATVSRRLSERARNRSPAGSAPDDAMPAAQSATGALRNFFEKLAEAAQALGTEATAITAHLGELPLNLGGKQGSAVFGYTVRMGLDGLRAERFGDTPPQPSGSPTGAAARTTLAPSAAARAPIVDIFEEGGEIRVVAELPGVAEQDCVCELDGGALCIKTQGSHLYSKTVHLPTAVDSESLQYSCHNGILEARLRRSAAA